ncbi:MAG: hypothetical protein ACRD63_07595, partial [Pyrinomonadaceae bacterium]
MSSIGEGSIRFIWQTFPKCACKQSPSPILIDIDGDGFSLTDEVDGVDFDITSDGRKERISWTAPDSDDAF